MGVLAPFMWRRLSGVGCSTKVKVSLGETYCNTLVGFQLSNNPILKRCI